MPTRTSYGIQNKHIRAFFNELAPRWDASLSDSHGKRLAGIVAELAIQPGDQVLDVGTGTGILLDMLAQPVGPAGQVIGLDLSETMLLEAAAKSRSPHVSLLQGDIHNLPLPSDSLDLVVCNSVFPHFAEQQAGLLEIARVLKPKRCLVICHTQSRHAINALHQAIGGVVQQHHLPASAGLQRIVEAAGFRLLNTIDREDRYLAVMSRQS